MIDFPLLSILTFTPLAGAILMLIIIRGDDETVRGNYRTAALFVTVATFLISLFVWFQFDSSTHEYQFVEESEWIGFGITYRMGLDGISMPLVMLTTFLMPLCILASWEAIQHRVRE